MGESLQASWLKTQLRLLAMQHKLLILQLWVQGKAAENTLEGLVQPEIVLQRCRMKPILAF